MATVWKRLGGRSISATTWTLLKGALAKSIEDRVPKLAAALAYYTVFSLVPLLVIAVAAAGYLFGPEAARGEIAVQISKLVGPAAAAAIQSTIRTVDRDRRGGVVAALVGALVLIYGATVMFYDVQESLDLIWKVRPPDKGAFWRAPRNWLTSVAVALGMGALLIFSVLLSGLLAAADPRLSDGPWLGRSMVAWSLSFALAASLFAGAFKFLPDARVPWRSVWVAAVATACLFTLGKLLLALCLKIWSPTTAYGAAGSLAAMLLWFYYCAQVLYFGAELCQVHATAHERAAAPAG